MIKGLRNAFSLLPQNDRRRAITSVLFTILQASLDVFSLAAIIPIFYAFFATTEISFFNISVTQLKTHWQLMLTLIVVTFAIKNFLGLWLARSQANFLSDISVSLSEKLYRQFYQQSWTQYLQTNSAENVRKIKGTSSDYAQYVLQGYILFIADFLSCILMLALMVVYDYRVVMIILILCLPIVLFYFLFRKKIISKIDRSFRELTPVASIVLTQGVDSFSEARIYNKENFFIERFMSIRRATSQQLADLKAASNLPSRLFELTGIVCFSAIIVYAQLSKEEDPNVIILLGLLSIAMYRVIPSFNRMLLTLSQIEAYGYSVAEIKTGFGELAGPSESGDTNAIRLHEKIELINLSFSYDQRKKVLTDLNLLINKGDFIMIQGPSGIGKSTFLHVVAGLLQNYQGDIIVDGATLHTEDVRRFQKSIAFVPQAPILIQDTLAKNITFSEDSEIDFAKLSIACENAALTSFIETLPLAFQTAIGENGTNVSGGQRQRITLARALYRDADLLILDETTNQLDEKTKAKVLENLRKLCAAGKTIILSSHDSFVKQYVNKIIKL
jgi:ABC-type bacteriocin/lantibiotic exporter with double-glycine peptidase domain